MLLVERWILARLRHQTFFSLPELNTAIRALLEDLNTRPFKKLPGSRRTLFESVDKPAMSPLPPERYGPPEVSKGAGGACAYRLPRRGRWALLPMPW